MSKTSTTVPGRIFTWGAGSCDRSLKLTFKTVKMKGRTRGHLIINDNQNPLAALLVVNNGDPLELNIEIVGGETFVTLGRVPA